MCRIADRGSAASRHANCVGPRVKAESEGQLTRGFGLKHAIALNISNMVGVGPFLTIPLLLATMGRAAIRARLVRGCIARRLRRTGVE